MLGLLFLALFGPALGQESCTFTTSKGTFDLSPLQDRSLDAKDSISTFTEYTFSVCGNTAKVPSSCPDIKDASGVQILTFYSECYLLSTWDTTGVLTETSNGFQVAFSNGDTTLCTNDVGEKINRSVTYDFQCDQDTEVGTLVMNEPDVCKYEVTIPTKYACAGLTPAPTADVPDVWAMERQNAMVDLDSCEIDENSKNVYGYIEPFSSDTKQGCFANLEPDLVPVLKRSADGGFSVFAKQGQFKWLFVVEEHGFLVHWREFTAGLGSASMEFKLPVMPYSLTAFAFDEVHGLWQGITKVVESCPEECKNGDHPADPFDMKDVSYGPYYNLLLQNKVSRDDLLKIKNDLLKTTNEDLRKEHEDLRKLVKDYEQDIQDLRSENQALRKMVQTLQ